VTTTIYRWPTSQH